MFVGVLAGARMTWLLGGVALYGIAVGGLYVMQDGMIFPREAALQPKYPMPARAEEINVPSTDGHELVGYLVRALGNSRGLLLGFTGNAWNAQDCLTFLTNRVSDWDLVVFHYRGYAPSEGKPSQQALFDDALLIHDRMQRALQPNKTLAVGFSLGSGVVSYLAAERPLDGQLLVTPFDSIASIAKKRYRIVPVSLLLKHPFDSIAHQARNEVPAAVILASDDKVVPRPHSEKLIAGLANPVFLETLQASHGGIYDIDEIDDVLRNAIAVLDGASESPPQRTEAEVE